MLAYTTVYHQHGILVVNKHSGLSSQPAKSGERNLFDQLRAEHAYVGMHHRLDQPASGLLLFTTDPSYNKQLSQAFKAHSISRKYTLVVAGKQSNNQGSWTEPINGHYAETIWRKKHYARRMSLLEAELKTGRKHQIRIHAQLNGTPIVGDKRYGGFAGQLWPRLALHAHELSFLHPYLDQQITVCAPIPEDLLALMSQFSSIPPNTQAP